MKRMYSALDIAYWFLFKNFQEKMENETDEESYEGISNMKLQKLLYFSQGAFLALHNKKLFKDKIKAWAHGPVIPNVYHEFRKFKKDVIELEQSQKDKYMKIITEIETDEDVSCVLEEVYDSFNQYTAWQLRNFSHDPKGAWYKYYVPGKSEEINVDVLKKYFQENFVYE